MHCQTHMQLGQSETWSLRAAQGWLGLGCIREAKAEIRTIPRHLRTDPGVLAVRSEIYAATGKWRLAGRAARMIITAQPNEPSGYLRAANALHHLKHTDAAVDILRCVAKHFPDEFLIAYRLACYCCHLGNFRESWLWLKRAMKIGDKPKIELMATADPELQPLWKYRSKRARRRGPYQRPGR